MTTQTLLPFEPAQAMKFALAGNAVLTAKSEETGTHFTFKVRRADPKEGQTEPPRLWFVSVLTGPDNTTDYQYLGLVRAELRPGVRETPNDPLRYEHGVKSRISATAPSAVAARWIFTRLLRALPTPKCSVYHEGRCGRCGRALTVPESILSGFGPECIQHV